MNTTTNTTPATDTMNTTPATDTMKEDTMNTTPATDTTTTDTTTTDTTPADLFTLPDNLTNGLNRRSYVFMNCSDVFAKLTRKGVAAYHDATIDDFVAAFAGTLCAIDHANAEVTHSAKNGDRYRIVITSANYGTFYLTTNSTASIDWRKIARKYVDKCEKRHNDNIANNTPEKVAQREAAKAEKKQRRAVRTYYNNLIKHNAPVELAKQAAETYAASIGVTFEA